MRQRSKVTPQEEEGGVIPWIRKKTANAAHDINRKVIKTATADSQPILSFRGLSRRGSLLRTVSGPKQRSITLFYTEGNFNKAHSRQPSVYFQVIHPNGRFRRTFDCITVIWVLVLVFMVPFEIGFDWYESSKLENFFLDLLDVWFAIDILLNFRTGYIHHGTIIMDPKKVVSNYLTSWFVVDFLGTFPFERIINNGDLSTRKSLKLIKYFKIPKLLRVSRVLKYVRVHKFVYDIFQVFVLVFTFMHVGACVWMLILSPCSDVENVSHNTGLCAQDNVSRLYAESFHLSATMMLGVSNSHIIGDSSTLDMLTEKRENQRVLTYTTSALFMICGLFLTALLISELCVFLFGKMQGSAAFQRKINRVKHEMEYYAVPAELQMQVKAFYDYIWIHQKQYDDQIALLSDDQMSTDLQRKLSLHLYKDVVSHISIFSDIDDLLLGEICLSLRTRIFLPKDMILFKGDVGKELFIIAKGVVEVLRDDLPPEERQRSLPILLKSGSFFGEIALIMETRRTCSVQARTVCEVNTLQQSTFDNILLGNPDFARRMNELVVTRLDEKISRMTQGASDDEDMDAAMSVVEKSMKRGLERRMRRDSGFVDSSFQFDSQEIPDGVNGACKDSQGSFAKHESTGDESTQQSQDLYPSSFSKGNGEMTPTSSEKSEVSRQRSGTAPTNEMPHPSSLPKRRSSWSVNSTRRSSIVRFHNELDTNNNTFKSERIVSKCGRDEKSHNSISFLDGEGEDTETMLVTGHFHPDRVVVDRKKVLPSILLHNRTEKDTIQKLESQNKLQSDVIKTLLKRVAEMEQEGKIR